MKSTIARSIKAIVPIQGQQVSSGDFLACVVGFFLVKRADAGVFTFALFASLRGSIGLCDTPSVLSFYAADVSSSQALTDTASN